MSRSRAHQPYYDKKGPVQLPTVLFMDYNGWWAPLNNMYFSSSSKILVSRHAESSIEESVSHYCPQCVNKYSEDDLHTYKNKCPSCFQCPICSSPLSAVALTTTVCCFQCAMCTWRSDASGIVGADQQDLESSIMERERNTVRQDAFEAILSSYQKEDGLSMPPAYRKQGSLLNSEWTVADAAIIEAKTSTTLNPTQSSALYAYMQSHNIPKDSSPASTMSVAQATSYSMLTNLSQRQISMSLQLSDSSASLSSNLLPGRVPLRPKKMLRCRKDVRDGKLSILVQPKLNPLEGDSSFKLLGKWWTKDSSAVHFVPTITVTSPPSLERSVTWMEDVSIAIVFLHISLMNLKEMNVMIGLEVVSALSECVCVGDSVDSHPTGEKHPAFDHQPLALIAAKSRHECSGILLASYEDELLRDEDEAETATVDVLAPEHACGDWGVTRSGHTGNICIPLLANSLIAANSSAVPTELLMVMYVADSTSSGEEALLNRESAVKVFVRLVFPPQSPTVRNH